MSNIGQVPEELAVGRGDPAYMAHAYLTKVPVGAYRVAVTPSVSADSSSQINAATSPIT